MDAKEANDQLERFFEPLLKDIAKGDFESYAKATDILEKWLNTDPKTHYPAVRVEIIRSLFVTQARVREEVNFTHGFGVTFKALQYAENRFVGEYIKLVKAIKPLEGIFAAEVKGLRDGFQAILATISTDDDPLLRKGESSQSNCSKSVSPSVLPKPVKPKRKIDFEALVKADEQDFLRKQALAAQAKAKHSENINEPQPLLVTMTSQVVQPNSPTTKVFEPVADPVCEVTTKLEVAAKIVNPSDNDSLDENTLILPDTDLQTIGQEVDHNREEVMATRATESDVETPQGVIGGTGHLSDEEVVAELVQMDVDRKRGQMGIFGPEMTVIARQLGLEDSFHISIEFEITHPQYELLSKWIHQQETTDVTGLQAGSICITLGCYLLTDLKEVYENNPTLGSFEKQVSCTPAKWPDYPGSLHVKILSPESEENLPLSPPFHVTPDNLVDLSSLLVLGKNKIELSQKCDLRNFMFTLHAHHPTQRQIAQIEERRQKHKEWQEFIDQVAVPFATDAFAGLTLDRYLRR